MGRLYNDGRQCDCRCGMPDPDCFLAMNDDNDGSYNEYQDVQDEIAKLPYKWLDYGLW